MGYSRVKYFYDHPVAMALNYGQIKTYQKLLDRLVPVPEDDRGTNFEPSLGVRIRQLLDFICEREGLPVELSMMRKIRTDRLPKAPAKFRSKKEEREFQDQQLQAIAQVDEDFQQTPEFQAKRQLRDEKRKADDAQRAAKIELFDEWVLTLPPDQQLEALEGALEFADCVAQLKSGEWSPENLSDKARQALSKLDQSELGIDIKIPTSGRATQALKSSSSNLTQERTNQALKSKTRALKPTVTNSDDSDSTTRALPAHEARALLVVQLRDLRSNLGDDWFLHLEDINSDLDPFDAIQILQDADSVEMSHVDTAEDPEERYHEHNVVPGNFVPPPGVEDEECWCSSPLDVDIHRQHQTEDAQELLRRPH